MLLVQPLYALLDTKRGTDGPLGVILVGRGHTENGEDAVTEEFLDAAVVALDLLPDETVIERETLPRLLGIH